MMDRPFFSSRKAAFLAFAALVTGTTTPSQAATPSPVAALGLKPVQRGVDYQKVAADEVSGCQVLDLDRDDWSGWEVISPDGTVLRRFADSNGDKKVDLWCYFQQGVEVYRDVDADFNGKADQYRWLGTNGTRWGVDDDEDGRIDRWKQISPEEVSMELVASLREADAKRFTRLLATSDELRQVGLAASKAETLSEKASRAAREFPSLVKEQQAVGPSANWIQFASAPPGVVPAGTDGSSKDVTVYENAIAMFEQGGENGQLLVGTIIQVGDAWRLVGLPSVVGQGEALAQSSGSFFTPGGSSPQNATAASGISGEAQKLVTQLEAIDAQLAQSPAKSDLPALHAQRADVVEKLVATASDAEERDTWVRQLVDTVGVAVQSGVYPEGLERLKRITSSLDADDKALKAYADFQVIGTEYVVRQSTSKDFAEVQEWYLNELTRFVEQYPGTREAGQAMLQLALSKEFEDKESDALDYYKQVAKTFASTDAGAKAAGAVRRLESVGQEIELSGQTIDGQPFRLSSLQGRPVVLHYWATWCEPCKQDMKLLRRLKAQYQRAGLELVGINVDADKAAALNFLKQNPLPWTQLFEAGGLESSPLANAFGVQTLPTMMLIDSSGKVVRHNVRAAELPNELDEMLKTR